jgi:hypothetical protein
MAGLKLMGGAPTDVWLTAVRVVVGILVVPAALVVAAYLVQAWWSRRIDSRVVTRETVV